MKNQKVLVVERQPIEIYLSDIAAVFGDYALPHDLWDHLPEKYKEGFLEDLKTRVLEERHLSEDITGWIGDVLESCQQDLHGFVVVSGLV